MAKKNPKRAMTEQDKINLAKGKKFTTDYQPDPQKVSIGKIKANAEKRDLENTVDILTRVLQKLIKDKQGQELTAKEAMLLALLQKALKGDIKAIELIIKLIGEMPADKQEITNTTPQIVVATQSDADVLQRIADVNTDKDVS